MLCDERRNVMSWYSGPSKVKGHKVYFNNPQGPECSKCVCTPEAHPEAQPTLAAWSTRRPGRVCSGRHCSESAAARIAGCATATPQDLCTA
jgi:hypothetical protein